MTRFWIVLAAICLLLVPPLPAIADAHPGWHVNPHFPTVVLYVALGLAVTAWIGMLVTLAILRIREKRATDRLMRTRLYLGQARDELTYWRGRRAYWRSRLFTSRATCEITRILDHEPNGTTVEIPARRMVQPPRE